MSTRHIHSIRELDNEIRRQQQRLREIERSLDQHAGYLKENYRMMAFRSLLGSRFASRHLGMGAEVLLRLMESESLQDGLMSLFDKLGGRIRKVFSGSQDKEAKPEGQKTKRRRRSQAGPEA